MERNDRKDFVKHTLKCHQKPAMHIPLTAGHDP